MMPYLLIQLAIMLNIAKWMYFFLVMKTHRDIRIVEINAQIFTDEDSIDSQAPSSEKNKPNNVEGHLKQLERHCWYINIVFAVLAIPLCFVYIYYTNKSCKASFDSDFVVLREVDSEADLMRWIILVNFTVILTIVSLIMMCKIRLRFHKLYTEYGCLLRAIYIMQGISILFLTIVSLL